MVFDILFNIFKKKADKFRFNSIMKKSEQLPQWRMNSRSGRLGTCFCILGGQTILFSSRNVRREINQNV